MEGPSLVILVEELKPFLNQKIKLASGAAPWNVAELTGTVFTEARSWGKHLLLGFQGQWVRIHFLMFGSYRLNEKRDREPKLSLAFPHGEANFYTCSVKRLDSHPDDLYDWSIDVMAPAWDEERAVAALRRRGSAMVCDVLMDQDVFAGVGNIIKNEVLFRMRLHPETKLGDVPLASLRRLVMETRAYCQDFMRWKKASVLKKNWQIFRKRSCPSCQGVVTKVKTGYGQRISHFCPTCQIPASGPKAKREPHPKPRKDRSSDAPAVGRRKQKRP